MKIHLQLTNKDYLTYQLYTSSKTLSHKKKRMRGRVIIPILFLILGSLLLITTTNKIAFFIYLAIALIWFILHPYYSAWLYKNHFKKHIRETYKNRVDKPAELTFLNDSVEITDESSETKLKSTEFQELIELPEYYFLKLKSDVSIIFPKTQISNPLEFLNYFENLQVSFKDESNWKWS